jgi:phosphate starvation-inducible protein PhoH and related proteins
MKHYSSSHKSLLNSLYCKHTPVTVVVGPAGSGKTYISCTAAIRQLHKKDVDKIIITRPTKTVDEDNGYLPGNINNKMNPYLKPIYDCFLENITAHQLKKYIDSSMIEICPIGYMRGRTFHNSFIIADECQNTSINQMQMLLTRIGEKSRMVITGDLNQSDLNVDVNGLRDIVNRCDKHFEGSDECVINIVKFKEEDIIRSDVVRQIVELYNIKL